MIIPDPDAFEESVRAANSAGINDRITKPVDPGKTFRYADEVGMTHESPKRFLFHWNIT